MTIPTKTALGHEELKSRAQRLGQRHRTILFLVDGRRPLAEVLSLAQQAGADTAHFEDLVRLGLVEVPAEPEPPQQPIPPVPALDEPPGEVTEVRLDVPPVAEEPPLEAPPEPAVAQQPRPIEPPGVDVAPPFAQAPVPAVLPPAPASRALPRELPVLGEEAAVDPLQQVRDLLIDTLRFDAPLFSARMFMRVRNARTTSELIDLVWEIQDYMTRRHAQRELLSLQRARELLGLGNTVVSEDSTRPPLLDE